MASNGRKTNGYPTLEKARVAAQRAANRSGWVKIVHDTTDNVYRTSVYPHAWPQYETVETVQPIAPAFQAKMDSLINGEARQ